MFIKVKIKRLLEGLPKRVKIGREYVGPGRPIFMIAEIGINHNGQFELAKRLIKEAKDAGADAVKFQKRTPQEILIKKWLEKPYTSPHAYAQTYGEHRKKLELSEKDYYRLKKYADDLGILFFASVWDFKSADFMESLDVAAYKIPSADVINLPLLEYVAKKDRPVLLSTGMNTIEEIDEAVKTILKYNSRLIIFHCVSLYPCPEEKIDLNFMNVLRERYKPLPVGYSGHEMGYLPTLTAVAMGAQIIERHFTLDKTMKGSDHAASLEPQEFKKLIENIRKIEKIRGKAEKIIYPELKPLREKLAKSIVAKKTIPKGTVIKKEMLCIKGPGSGIKPSLIGEVIGRVSQVDIQEDTLIPLETLRWPRKWF